jgi:hypothetical protein
MTYLPSRFTLLFFTITTTTATTLSRESTELLLLFTLPFYYTLIAIYLF